MRWKGSALGSSGAVGGGRYQLRTRTPPSAVGATLIEASGGGAAISPPRTTASEAEYAQPATDRGNVSTLPLTPSCELPTDAGIAAPPEFTIAKKVKPDGPRGPGGPTGPVWPRSERRADVAMSRS